MVPQVQYLQAMAQRFAGTPLGQWFASQADKAMTAARGLESRYDIATKTPMAPIGRGAAAGLGIGSIAAGGTGALNRPELDALFKELDARGAGAPARVPPPSGMISQLDARGAAAPSPAPAPMPAPVRSTDSTLYGEDVGPRPAPIRVSDSTLAGYDMPPERAARNAVRVAQSVMPPSPPPRPAEAERPAVEPSARALWTRYNESESPADFVRADRLGRAEGGGIPEGMMGARPMPSLDLPPMDGPPPMSDMPPLGGMSPASKPTAGAGAGGRDAAINKALEIIHHLVIRGR